MDMWLLCGERPPGYEIVMPDSSEDPPDDDPFNDPRTGEGRVTAVLACPADKRLLAIGASLSVSSERRGLIGLSLMRPSADGRSATIEGVDDATDDTTDAGRAFTFRLSPVRVCANRPAGYTVVGGSESPFDDSPAKSRLATCPTGRIAYGSGFSTVDGRGHARIDGVVPGLLNASGLPRRYTVRGEQREPLQTWSLRAFVICADPF